MKKNKIAASILLAASSAFAVFLYQTLRPDPEMLHKKRLAERSLGSERAAVWVTEYFDYQCPPCAKATQVLKEAVEKNPGKIYLQVRHFPLPGHKNAMRAAVYGECASRQQGRFWLFHDKIFENQKQWAEESYPHIHFADYAKQAGLDLSKLDACAADPEIQKFVEEEKSKGKELGVQITPSFFVNGKMVVGVLEMQKALQAELEKAAASS